MLETCERITGNDMVRREKLVGILYYSLNESLMKKLR